MEPRSTQDGGSSPSDRDGRSFLVPQVQVGSWSSEWGQRPVGETFSRPLDAIEAEAMRFVEEQRRIRAEEENRRLADTLRYSQTATSSTGQPNFTVNNIRSAFEAARRLLHEVSLEEAAAATKAIQRSMANQGVNINAWSYWFRDELTLKKGVLKDEDIVQSKLQSFKIAARQVAKDLEDDEVLKALGVANRIEVLRVIDLLRKLTLDTAVTSSANTEELSFIDLG